MIPVSIRTTCLYLRKSNARVTSKINNFIRSHLTSCTGLNCIKFLSTAVIQNKEELVLDITEKEPKKKKKTFKTKLKAPTKSTSALSPSTLAIFDRVSNQSGIKDHSLFRLLPKQFLKNSTIIPTSVYLIDKSESQRFGKAINDAIPDKDTPLLELHPGLGLLTSELITRFNYKYVTCFEDCAGLGENLASNYNVTVVDCSIDDLPRHFHLDKHDGGERINCILTTISEQTNTQITNSKKPLCILGALPDISPINFLMRCYVTKRVFFEEDLPWSGVSMVVALGAKAEHICTATPETGLVAYRPTSVLFQTLFKTKHLGKISREAFIPWEADSLSSPTKGKRRMKIEDVSNMKLLHVEINYEVQEKIGKNNLFTYWYFVRQHLYARSNRVIPELERWVPGCGARLVRMGFTIFSQFGELQPAQILQLYLEFVSWPEFSSSSFLNAVEKFQTRLELTEDDDENK